MAWENVSQPDVWNWDLPFTIQKDGRTFRIDPTFTLQGRANITITTTYYVDADNGNDGNSGADWANAFATLNQIETEGDADRVYARGTFGSGTFPAGFTRDTELISDTGATISASFVATKDSLTYYFENITWSAGLTIRNNSSTGGLKCYFKDCTLYSITVAGVDEVMWQGCEVTGSTADGMNYDARNGLITRAVEDNCTMHDMGTGPTNQASTGHNTCEIVRISGSYYNTTGQVIADVNSCQTWMLGITTYGSDTDDNFYCSGSSGIAWLDSCTVTSTGDYDLDAGSLLVVYPIIYIRDFLPQNYTSTGTILSYDSNRTATLEDRPIAAGLTQRRLAVSLESRGTST